MARRLPLAVTAVALAWGAFAAPAARGIPGTEDVRRAVQKALSEKEVRERANALDAALAGADSAAAARAVAELVFREGEAQLVLDVGVLGAGRMKGDEAVLALAKEAETGPRLRRVLVAEALGRGSTATGGTALEALLRHEDPRTRAAAAAAIGRRREPTSARPVADSLGDAEWTVRSALLGALRSIGDPRAVADVAAAMRREDGRLVDDCAATLARISGKRLGADPAAYEEAAGLPKSEDPGWKAPAPAFESPLFSVRTRRVLFVLSTAETMKDPVSDAAHDARVLAAVAAAGEDLADDLRAAKTKLDVARVHLRAMLRTLRDGVTFDVMTYSASAVYAFGEWTPAGPDARKRAETRIAKLSPGGDPDLGEALRRIFDPKGKDALDAPDGPDTVVLLTDGAIPAKGEGSDRTEVGPPAARWNLSRQIRFVAVAVGQSDPESLQLVAGGSPGGFLVSVP